MGLGGAVQAHFIGFIAPDNYLPALTFQVWTMLIVGGSGNNAGAILGAVVVWGLWSGSGAAITALVPARTPGPGSGPADRRHRGRACRRCSCCARAACWAERAPRARPIGAGADPD